MNGIAWHIRLVKSNSPILKRSDGSWSVGACDKNDRCIYLSENLHGSFLERVLCHELTHAACLSWNVSISMETEELICDFMSKHGKEIIYILDNLMRNILIKTA